MRDNFWKWLKRFFVIVPIVMMLLQIVFRMGSYWRDNGTYDFTIGQEDFIQDFVSDGSWLNNELSNPLLYNPYEIEGIYGTIQDTFISIFGYLNNYSFSSYAEIINTNATVVSYEIIIINFLTWWVFVELVFLFFRFVTFLISWVNSLFDNTFKKIKK